MSEDEIKKSLSLLFNQTLSIQGIDLGGADSIATVPEDSIFNDESWFCFNTSDFCVIIVRLMLLHSVTFDSVTKLLFMSSSSLL